MLRSCACGAFSQTELDVVPKNKSISIRNHPPNGFDGLILRFRGYWDDRYELEGELHFYEVLYYLADDTMELVEELTDDNRPEVLIRKTFVKRQKLPMVRVLPSSFVFRAFCVQLIEYDATSHRKC